MTQSNHTIQILSRKLGLPNLAFNADGHIALEITSTVTVDLIDLGDGLIEMMCTLTDTDPPDEATMRAMLEGNFMGAGVDGARLSISPDTSDIVLCERLATADLDAAAIERRFDEFTALAVFWQGDGALSLMEAATVIRVEKMKREREEAMAQSHAGEELVMMRL